MTLSLSLQLDVEHIIREGRLVADEEIVKSGGRNINSLRYADDTTLQAENSETLKQVLV